ncbi:hypothetical protein C2845_PM17G06010 [Panicum miliaceum]|uniref:Uncharacterized protein n=1 Tax=Panicum miliaceum TaxID=4540 RepID=A0A3L6Q2H0_PANMI|nr:hypothetical protein C2845_PM17G06010 [Panicum miliaceum]
MMDNRNPLSDLTNITIATRGVRKRSRSDAALDDDVDTDHSSRGVTFADENTPNTSDHIISKARHVNTDHGSRGASFADENTSNTSDHIISKPRQSMLANSDRSPPLDSSGLSALPDATRQRCLTHGCRAVIYSADSSVSEEERLDRKRQTRRERYARMDEDPKNAINTRKRENHHRLRVERSTKKNNTVDNTPGLLAEESAEALNIDTHLPGIMHSQSEILDELIPEVLKRVRERNRYDNLSTLAKQHRISKILEDRLNNNRNNNALSEGNLSYVFTGTYGLEQTAQTGVTQACTGPVTRARSNDQRNRVHFESGIWEPEDPEQINEDQAPCVDNNREDINGDFDDGSEDDIDGGKSSSRVHSSGGSRGRPGAAFIGAGGREGCRATRGGDGTVMARGWPRWAARFTGAACGGRRRATGRRGFAWGSEEIARHGIGEQLAAAARAEGELSDGRVAAGGAARSGAAVGRGGRRAEAGLALRSARRGEAAYSCWCLGRSRTRTGARGDACSGGKHAQRAAAPSARARHGRASCPRARGRQAASQQAEREEQARRPLGRRQQAKLGK